MVSSHVLMTRAGLIKKLGAGLYHMLPMGLRSFRKVERIIREEMDAAGALEFQLPILTPAELWRRSGRWDTMGPEMFRLTDRHQAENVLGPTHEESFTELLSGVLRSYRDLPRTVYQIHTKFRDEIRPRFGVMRSREFCMKDAYSFDRDDESLDRSYQAMRVAYRRIFARLGLETIPVEADTGTMGGSASEEFMVPSEIGEETLLVSTGGQYAGNQEKTPVIYTGAAQKPAANKTAKKTAKKSSKSDFAKKIAEGDGRSGAQAALEKIHTPGTATIEAVANFLGVRPNEILKTVLYEADGKPVAVCLRADRQVNEVKLMRATRATLLAPASAETIAKLGSAGGYIGPAGLDPSVRVFWDRSIYGATDPAEFSGAYVIGANEKDYHAKGWQPGHLETVDLALAVAGDPSPAGDGVLEEKKGIEVGHIFKLGDKYAKAFEIQVLDENGKGFTPTMGCYGIGVNRTLAAIIEQNHDENGIAFPVPAAPFEMVLVSIAKQPDELARMEELYEALRAEQNDVLWDDRDLRPGVKFNDADLIGFPIRLTAGKNYLEQGVVEVLIRSTNEKKEITGTPVEIARRARELVDELGASLRKKMKFS